jgi:hypothetical protein
VNPRTKVRDIPDTDRYFHVETSGSNLGTVHLRFPSYGMATRLVGLLQGLEQGDGLDKLSGLLDVAGYAIGACWWHRVFDLAAGPAPRDLSGDGWQVYGDTVIDELQESGARLPDIMSLVNRLISELGERMSEAAGDADPVAVEPIVDDAQAAAPGNV